MRLYRTKDYYENPIFIGQFDNQQSCSAAMITDIINRGEKSYYTRHWVDEKEREVVDYGSHKIFYVITKDNDELK